MGRTTGKVIVPGGTPRDTIDTCRHCGRLLVRLYIHDGIPPEMIREHALAKLRAAAKDDWGDDEVKIERMMCEYQRGIDAELAKHGR